MSRTTVRRLLAKSPFTFTPEIAPVCRAQSPCLRLFSQTSRRRADEDTPRDSASSPATDQSLDGPDLRNQTQRMTKAPRGPRAPMFDLATNFNAMLNENQQNRISRGNSYPNATSELSLLNRDKHAEPHHFHIYAHRHNCHITLTKPDRSPIISISCGQIGFKKAGRKTYDAAFQLASYVMGRITDRGIHLEIDKLEVTLRGFGLGREAVTKALMGTEGRFLRGKVVKVQDATRLKFGGTRSRKPRRLG